MLSEAVFATLFDAEARYATFKDKWPHDFENVTPRMLADNGFIYSGNEDHVQCFACGKELQNWEETDNIMDEHQRRNECIYVSHIKSGGSASDLNLERGIMILKEIYRRTIGAIDNGAVFEASDLKKCFNGSKAKRKPKKKL